MPYRTSNRALAETGIGTILRRARMRRGHSQEELANCVGMSASSISHIEQGSDLKASTLLRVAAECHLEILFVPKETVPFVRALLDERSSRKGHA